MQQSGLELFLSSYLHVCCVGHRLSSSASHLSKSHDRLRKDPIEINFYIIHALVGVKLDLNAKKQENTQQFLLFLQSLGNSGLSWALSTPTPTLELRVISPELVFSPWTITAWSKLQCKACEKVFSDSYKKCSMFYSSCVKMWNGNYTNLGKSSHYWKCVVGSYKGNKGNWEIPNPLQEMTFSTWTLHHCYGSGTCSLSRLFFYSWNSFQASCVFMHQILVKKEAWCYLVC